MTIEQASERFCVPLDKLQCYEAQGLFECHKNPDGSINYSDELMDYIAIINILMTAGAKPEDVRGFMQKLMQSTITKEEKLHFLQHQRKRLMEDIHRKQKSLDQLDYIIYDVKKLPNP